jgi:hypothetical protein
MAIQLLGAIRSVIPKEDEDRRGVNNSARRVQYDRIDAFNLLQVSRTPRVIPRSDDIRACDGETAHVCPTLDGAIGLEEKWWMGNQDVNVDVVLLAIMEIDRQL